MSAGASAMGNPRWWVGHAIDDLDTPFLLVDLERFESNVAHLASYCRRHSVAWRPHSKVHKSLAIARIQRAAGAVGVTCAKLSEAQVMARGGIDDILLANQITSVAKLRRLAQLQQHARVIGIVDDPQAVSMAGQAATEAGHPIPLLVDVDLGMHRTGVPPGGAVVELARRVADTPGVEFLGVMGYEGHVLKVEPPAVKARACRQALDGLTGAREALAAADLPPTIVSAGGTGSYALTAAHPGITEVQAGGGIFMDAFYREACHVGGDLGFALTLLATVTGRHSDHVVLDAGFKTLSAYHYPPRVLHRDDLEFDYLSAEHGVFRMRPGGEGPRLGERLQLLPGYGDSTTCLHDHFIGARDGRVEVVWELDGRGALT